MRSYGCCQGLDEHEEEPGTRLQRRSKAEIPNPTSQVPSNAWPSGASCLTFLWSSHALRAPLNMKTAGTRTGWFLKFGASLELGAWSLDLIFRGAWNLEPRAFAW